MSLKISHAGAGADEAPTRPQATRTPDRVVSAPQRERYIAPPKRGRR